MALLGHARPASAERLAGQQERRLGWRSPAAGLGDGDSYPPNEDTWGCSWAAAAQGHGPGWPLRGPRAMPGRVVGKQRARGVSSARQLLGEVEGWCGDAASWTGAAKRLGRGWLGEAGGHVTWRLREEGLGGFGKMNRGLLRSWRRFPFCKGPVVDGQQRIAASGQVWRARWATALHRGWAAQSAAARRDGSGKRHAVWAAGNGVLGYAGGAGKRALASGLGRPGQASRLGKQAERGGEEIVLG